jgi:iron complex outermembrane receptor protein
VALEQIPTQLAGIVVSVSRRAEEITRAPATVTAFSGGEVTNTLGGLWTELLQRTPSITVTQTGVLSSSLNGRGFNKSFNSRWLTVEDGRLAILPETGSAVGENTAISKIDVAGAEVIAGAVPRCTARMR